MANSLDYSLFIFAVATFLVIVGVIISGSFFCADAIFRVALEFLEDAYGVHLFKCEPPYSSYFSHFSSSKLLSLKESGIKPDVRLSVSVTKLLKFYYD